jgi:hypothetical protein
MIRTEIKSIDIYNEDFKSKIDLSLDELGRVSFNINLSYSELNMLFVALREYQSICETKIKNSELNSWEMQNTAQSLTSAKDLGTKCFTATQRAYGLHNTIKESKEL